MTAPYWPKRQNTNNKTSDDDDLITLTKSVLLHFNAMLNFRQNIRKIGNVSVFNKYTTYLNGNVLIT